MSASTNLLGDIGTVITNGPDSTTKANAIAAAGPIQDPAGNAALVKAHFQEAVNLLTLVDTVTDGSDGNKALVEGVIALLNGTASPSTAAITDLATAYAAGSTAASKALAIAAAGPIQDALGNISVARKKLQAASVLITAMVAVWHAGSDKTLLSNMNLALV